MKIAHLTSVHPTFDTRIFHKQCRGLARVGHEVVLITPHERDETCHGVRIRALPRPRNRIHRMTGTAWRVFRAALAERADIYHFHDPELMPIGVLLKLCGKRVVYDAHEDYPRDMLSKFYLSWPMRRLASIGVDLWERAATRCYDGVVVVFDITARRLPRKRTVTVQNYPMLEELKPLAAKRLGQRPPCLTYVGALSEVRGARRIVEAMGCLPEGVQATLILGGEFRPASLLGELSKLPGWSRVDFRGWMTREELRDALAESRAGIVIYLPELAYYESNSTKLFEYMAAGLPFIGSDFPFWRRDVGDLRCGCFVDPDNPQAIADAIVWVMEHPTQAEEMGQRGRDAVEQRFNWETELQALQEMYQSIIEGREFDRSMA